MRPVSWGLEEELGTPDPTTIRPRHGAVSERFTTSSRHPGRTEVHEESFGSLYRRSFPDRLLPVHGLDAGELSPAGRVSHRASRERGATGLAAAPPHAPRKFVCPGRRGPAAWEFARSPPASRFGGFPTPRPGRSDPGDRRPLRPSGGGRPPGGGDPRQRLGPRRLAGGLAALSARAERRPARGPGPRPRNLRPAPRRSPGFAPAAGNLPGGGAARSRSRSAAGRSRPGAAGPPGG